MNKTIAAVTTAIAATIAAPVAALECTFPYEPHMVRVVFAGKAAVLELKLLDLEDAQVTWVYEGCNEQNDGTITCVRFYKEGTLAENPDMVVHDLISLNPDRVTLLSINSSFNFPQFSTVSSYRVDCV